MLKMEHKALECTYQVNGEALERHLFSKGNYPANIWPVGQPWEGPEPAFL